MPANNLNPPKHLVQKAKARPKNLVPSMLDKNCIFYQLLIATHKFNPPNMGRYMSQPPRSRPQLTVGPCPMGHPAQVIIMNLMIFIYP